MKKNSKSTKKTVRKPTVTKNKKVNDIAKALDAYLRAEMQAQQKASINAIKSGDKASQKKRKMEAEKLAKSLATSLSGIAKKWSVTAPIKTTTKAKSKAKTKPKAKKVVGLSFRYADLGNCYSYIEISYKADNKTFSEQIDIKNFFEFIGKELLNVKINQNI